MGFNSNNIPLERVFNASQSSSSQLRRASVKNNENHFWNNSGINEGHSPGNTSNKSKGVEVSSGMRWDMYPKGSPRKVTGKRGPPPDAIIARVFPPKKRRVDLARGLQPQSAIHSNGLWHTKQGPRIPDLLPIQYDSWFFLPEMWEYCGPDGEPNKTEQRSPIRNGDRKKTYKSDRLSQDDDRENATAATVATWIELNRLRARYQQLVAEFHGGPLVVHHLADKESEEKLVAIAQASVGLEKAMAGVGRAAHPHPRLSWVTAPAPALKSITRPMGAMATQTTIPIHISPLDTLLSVTPTEEVESAQEPTSALAIATRLATSEASSAPPSYESLEDAIPSLAPVLPIGQEQVAPEAGPSGASPAKKATKRRRRTLKTLGSTTPPAVPSTSTQTFVISPTGQFRFTAAGEALFKLLCTQEKYNEAYAMLPAEQQFEHLTAADTIAEFRSVHPRPDKGGKGKKDETELWVCKAKVKLERKELPRTDQGGTPDYEFNVVYLDSPCNGTATTRCSMIRHKKRTHLGRLYEYNATE